MTTAQGITNAVMLVLIKTLLSRINDENVEGKIVSIMKSLNTPFNNATIVGKNSKLRPITPMYYRRINK